MGGKNSEVVVGFKYYLGLHLVLGYRVDELNLFTVDDREAWTGSVSSGSITVDEPELFGGKSREGGVSGTIDVLDGNPVQPKNDYLLAQLGSLIPAYRGVFSLVFRHFYIGNNPYLKKMAFRVRRTDTLTDGSPQWYQAKANINGGDLNAAHIIRECLTDSEWGMDYPASILDDAAFTVAADTLYTEGFGLTLLWNQQETIEQFVQRLLDHIDGVLRENPTTGDIGLYLIRDDYTPANLPLLDESNVLAVKRYERRAWGETVNEVTVVYHDRATDKDVPLTVQDIGNIQIQGAVIGQTRQYPGIPNGDLAARVAQRDLRVLSSPLSTIEIETNREAWNLRRGELFRFSWARYGLIEVIYRITAIEDGDLVDGRIQISAIEDVWGMPTSTYVTPEPSGWVAPNNAPAPAPYQQLVEASYWDVQLNVSAADIGQFDPDFGFVLAHAVQPSGDAFHYLMLARNGAAAYEEKTVGVFCATAELDGSLGIAEGGLTDVVINIRNPVGLEEVEADTFAYLGGEMVAVLALDIAFGTVTVDRGILDTVPIAHADGTRIWFADTSQGMDRTERVDAESVDVKLLPVTGLGTLPEGSATSMNLVLDNRYQRPYPPGNVRINGAAYPAAVFGEAAISWAHRDRTLQTAYFNDQTEGDIGPEPGTTYDLRIYGESDTLLRTITDMTGTAYTYLVADELADSGLSVQYPITLTNPGAETGDLTGWNNEIGAIQVYTEFSGIDPHSGTYQFGGGEYDIIRVASDSIDLIAAGLTTGQIDAGEVSMVLGYWQASLAGQDAGRAGLRFYDSGSSLISTSFNSWWAVTPVQTWVYREMIHAVPVGTRTVKIEIGMDRTGGTFNNVNIDDVTLAYAIGQRLNASLRFELESKRDGLLSRQKHNITVTRSDPTTW